MTHDDDSVKGRRWITEVGIQQISEYSDIECSILLKTEEISGLVTRPVQASRPNIVKELVTKCSPVEAIPGLTLKKLDATSARGFLAEVERLDRRHPLVVVSPLRSGRFIVDPDRLRALLVGLADVIIVPHEQDSFELEKLVGARYGAWGGAVNIIYQARNHKNGVICDSSIQIAKRLQDLQETGVNIDSYLLAMVTHKTNAANARKHISLEKVSHATLQAKLRAAIAGSKSSAEVSEYVQLLELADEDLSRLKDEIAELDRSLEVKENEIFSLTSQVDGLKHALDGQRQSSLMPDPESLDVLTRFRELLLPIIGSDKPKPTPEDSINLISALFPERITFLESAYDAARESRDFNNPARAFGLLWKLSSSYWEALSEGKGEQFAMKCFGKNEYAQNEAGALSIDGRRRRTFSYEDEEILMEKHLKIGIKDSLTETLRVHFHWVSDRKMIVVGHCGKHLDF